MTLREWMLRLVGAFLRRRVDDDLEEELRLHLELAAEDARRRGAGEDAVRLARLNAGQPMAAMDGLRDQRGLPASRILVATSGTACGRLRARPSSPRSPSSRWP